LVERVAQACRLAADQPAIATLEKALENVSLTAEGAGAGPASGVSAMAHGATHKLKQTVCAVRRAGVCVSFHTVLGALCR
jgi:hypothetical protein